MTAEVTVVDYGAGNLFSIARAVEHCGGAPIFADRPAAVRRAERVILPGVGAFADGMEALRRTGLDEAVAEFAATGRPLLGICLGMQMLMESSEEFGTHAGLGLIGGRVVPIPRTTADGAPHKVPHIGWNAVAEPAADRWAGTPLERTPAGTPFYFIHSFTVDSADQRERLATCEFGGRTLTAAVRRGAVVGCQFHPERSGVDGLVVIASFLAQ